MSSLTAEEALDSGLEKLARLAVSVSRADLSVRRGCVSDVIGLIIEAAGLEVEVGEICEISTGRDRPTVPSEVVGFRAGRTLLMPLGDMHGIGPGNVVIATGEQLTVPVGNDMLGRVLDGLGRPIDGGEDPSLSARRGANASPPDPLQRPRIEDRVSLGVRALDSLVPCGRGQRMGIFAGSGVGKSSLLGMIARSTSADINVICLVGERGREVREFIERDLGAAIERSVVVVAAKDPPLRPGLIDRCLVALQRGDATPLVCVNKTDLLDADEHAALLAQLAPYRELGIAVCLVAATTSAGLDELRERLRNRVAVFLGHSGVGKSSLLNALDPDGQRAVGAVRAFDGKGRHTTTAASLRRLADGIAVIDTPGVRAFGVEAPTLEELRVAFADLAAFAVRCRFRDCRHGPEPECAVRAAVAAGLLPAARVASWHRLLTEP